jgi:hypothetical protein
MTGTNNPTIESKSDDELEAELDALILGPFYNIIKRIRRNLRGVEINQVNRHILNRILSLSRDLQRMH